MKIFVSIFLFFILALSLSVTVDSAAMELQDEALQRSFVAFGLAKALNGVISLLQGTELSFTPVGVGLTFSIGEVLDPFNDMVERFSWVMLLATVSLGIQKFLLILSSKLFVQLAIFMSVSAVITLLWIKKIQKTHLLSYLFKFLLFLLLLRFSAVIFIYMSQFLYTSTLQLEYESATTVIEKTHKELEDLENKNKIAVASKKEMGFFDGVGSQYDRVVESLNISKQLETLEESIDTASSKIITLITIYVFQSVLMPLLYLWLLFVGIKLIFQTKFNEDKLKLLYN